MNQLKEQRLKEFDDTFSCGTVGCDCASAVGGLKSVKSFLSDSMDMVAQEEEEVWNSAIKRAEQIVRGSASIGGMIEVNNTAEVIHQLLIPHKCCKLHAFVGTQADISMCNDCASNGRLREERLRTSLTQPSQPKEE